MPFRKRRRKTSLRKRSLCSQPLILTHQISFQLSYPKSTLLPCLQSLLLRQNQRRQRKQDNNKIKSCKKSRNLKSKKKRSLKNQNASLRRRIRKKRSLIWKRLCLRRLKLHHNKMIRLRSQSSCLSPLPSRKNHLLILAGTKTNT